MIENGSKVKIHFSLTVDDQVVESSTDREPLTYVQGGGQIIPALEEALAEANIGDKKDITVPPEKGFGFPKPEAERAIPKKLFKDPEKVKVGETVSGGAGDQRIQGVVAEVGAEEVKVNLNHPLAGKTLQFAVEVVSVE